MPAGGDLAAGAGSARRRRAGQLPLDHPTSALSGGQKQRLALAGILAMRPGLILLDEPTANLDPAGVLEVRDAVGRCLDKTGATLVVVEHRVAVWKDLVDRIVVLQPGLGHGLRRADRRAAGPGPGPGAGHAHRRGRLGAGLRARRPGRAGRSPRDRAPRGTGAGQLLLAAEDLAVSRERPRRAGLARGFRTVPPVPVQSGITAQVRPARR